jgi:hypothetical protein
MKPPSRSRRRMSPSGTPPGCLSGSGGRSSSGDVASRGCNGRRRPAARARAGRDSGSAASQEASSRPPDAWRQRRHGVRHVLAPRLLREDALLGAASVTDVSRPSQGVQKPLEQTPLCKCAAIIRRRCTRRCGREARATAPHWTAHWRSVAPVAFPASYDTRCCVGRRRGNDYPLSTGTADGSR